MTIPEHFAIAQTSLQKTSFDDAHKNPMSKSQLVVYDFDAIKGWFQDTWEKETGREIHLRSNDALYVDVNGQPYFIEFKNGKLKKRSNTRTELHLKMYESFLIMAHEMTHAGRVIQGFEPSVDYSFHQINYILVYNGALNPPHDGKDSIREKVKAMGNIPRFGLAQYEGFLYRKVYTVTAEEFQRRFVDVWEHSGRCKA